MVCSVIVTDLRKLASASHLWTSNLSWDRFVTEANLVLVTEAVKVTQYYQENVKFWQKNSVKELLLQLTVFLSQIP